jgi:hypothetical protein
MSVSLWIALGVGSMVVIGWLCRGRDETIEMPVENDRAAVVRDPRLPNMRLEDRETGFLGAWCEGQRGGVRVAFQSYGKGIAIFAGDFDPDAEQLSETYLSQVGELQALPRDGSPTRIAVALEGDGEDLDPRFFLNATGGDYAQLRNSGVREALLCLSDSVTEVMLFESGGGVELITDDSATAVSVASDLDTAVSLFRALP